MCLVWNPSCVAIWYRAQRCQKRRCKVKVYDIGSIKKALKNPNGGTMKMIRLKKLK
ncbi:hypothetical protein HanRHA438_Chr11g0515331 [Helianthus annuus]|nr:hypothetical protein HanIR_Chr11g0541111 [Helianthus annuus]KAJ0871692.1 hypothetical protein HanRHA438_Chr11g0515331 [Helianthus annuus]